MRKKTICGISAAALASVLLLSAAACKGNGDGYCAFSTRKGKAYFRNLEFKEL